jgi:colanic acid/amylovoran biosynthesis glycosyltransferase
MATSARSDASVGKQASNMTTVAYVVSTHPGLFTYVSDEIDQLRLLGMRVVPMSLNTVQPADLIDDRDRDELGRTVFVKATKPTKIAAAVVGQVLRNPGNVVAAFRVALGYEPWNLKRLIWRLIYFVEACVVADHARRENVDHLHAHFGGAPSFVAWFASILLGDVPWSFTVHGPHDFFDEGPNQLQAKVRAAAFTVAISDYCRSQLLRIASSPEAASRIKIVRCGIDLTRFAFRPRSTRPAEELGPFRIVMVARLAAEKGQFVLLDALAELRQRGYDVVVDLVGSGPARPELERQVLDRRIGDYVTFHGAQPPATVATLLRSADVFCLPSFAEGLPMTIMEAMAIGIPVIATAINGTPELVEHGRTGQLVIAGRSHDVAEAVQALIKNPESASAMIVAARGAVEAAHNGVETARTLADYFIEAAGPLGRCSNAGLPA